MSIEMIGYAAATLTTFAFLPQLILAWKSDSLQSISLPMYLIFITGVFLWLLYGLLAEVFPIVLANLVTFIIAGLILILRVIKR